MTPLPLRLLARLRDNDLPLAGDLLEEYGRGRSLLWLWRQVVVALAAGAWGICRDIPGADYAPRLCSPSGFQSS